MANCKKCGVEIEEGAELCEVCKAAAEEAPAEKEIVQNDYVPEAPKGSGVLNVGMLVWSIINIVLCCAPLGIVSLVMTCIAKNAATPEDEAGKLKTAKICNICGTVFGLIVNVLSFFLGILQGLSESGVL